MRKELLDSRSERYKLHHSQEHGHCPTVYHNSSIGRIGRGLHYQWRQQRTDMTNRNSPTAGAGTMARCQFSGRRIKGGRS